MSLSVQQKASFLKAGLLLTSAALVLFGLIGCDKKAPTPKVDQPTPVMKKAPNEMPGAEPIPVTKVPQAPSIEELNKLQKAEVDPSVAQPAPQAASAVSPEKASKK